MTHHNRTALHGVRRSTRRSTPFARLLAAAVLIAAWACAAPAQAETRRQGLTSFERVVVLGDMIVEIVPDHRIFAVVEGERDAIDALSMEVNERVLTISQLTLGRFGPRPMNAPPVVIRIHAQNVAQIALRGAGSIRVTGMRGTDVRVELSGSGTIDAGIADARTLLLRANGGGSLTASGRAQAVNAYTNGAGSIDAAALTAGGLTVRSTGTGESRFTSNGIVDLTAIGQAGISVAGRPRCSVHNLGAGAIRCGDRADPVAHSAER